MLRENKIIQNAQLKPEKEERELKGGETQTLSSYRYRTYQFNYINNPLKY